MLIRLWQTKTKTFIYLSHFLFITIYVENDFCVHGRDDEKISFAHPYIMKIKLIKFHEEGWHILKCKKRKKKKDGWQDMNDQHKKEEKFEAICARNKALSQWIIKLTVGVLSLLSDQWLWARLTVIGPWCMGVWLLLLLSVRPCISASSTSATWCMLPPIAYHRSQ